MEDVLKFKSDMDPSVTLCLIKQDDGDIQHQLLG